MEPMYNVDRFVIFKYIQFGTAPSNRSHHMGHMEGLGRNVGHRTCLTRVSPSSTNRRMKSSRRAESVLASNRWNWGWSTKTERR